MMEFGAHGNMCVGFPAATTTGAAEPNQNQRKMKITIDNAGNYNITGKINPKPSSSGKSTLLISEKIDDAEQMIHDTASDGKRVRGSLTVYVTKK